MAQLDPLGIATGDPISSGDWHGGMRAFANEAVIRQHVRFGMNDSILKFLPYKFCTRLQTIFADCKQNNEQITEDVASNQLQNKLGNQVIAVELSNSFRY